jgi:hypothetical protein
VKRHGSKTEGALRLEGEAHIDGPRTGVLVSVTRGEVTVDFDGNQRGPVPARVSAGLDEAALSRAAMEKQEALLLFEGGDPTRPVVIALLRSSTPLLDAALAKPLPDSEKVARVDGRRVLIEGREEVVLRCGKATLTLRRDGTVVLRGVTIVTQAEAVQRIRGGKVQIN